MLSPANRQRQPWRCASSASACGVDRRLSACVPADSWAVGELAAASCSFNPSTCGGGGSSSRQADGEDERQPQQQGADRRMSSAMEARNKRRQLGPTASMQYGSCSRMRSAASRPTSLLLPPASAAAPHPADRWPSAPPAPPPRQTTASPAPAGAACRPRPSAPPRHGGCGGATAGMSGGGEVTRRSFLSVEKCLGRHQTAACRATTCAARPATPARASQPQHRCISLAWPPAQLRKRGCRLGPPPPRRIPLPA